VASLNWPAERGFRNWHFGGAPVAVEVAVKKFIAEFPDVIFADRFAALLATGTRLELCVIDENATTSVTHCMLQRAPHLHHLTPDHYASSVSCRGVCVCVRLSFVKVSETILLWVSAVAA
jgi:hypothetical protein